MSQHVIHYDHRSDDGPTWVGPFTSYGEATTHALSKARDGWTASYSIVPLTAPADDQD